MKINKDDFAPIEQLESDMKAIQEDAMKLAQEALLDGLQKVFNDIDKKDLSDRDYVKEIVSGACGATLAASFVHTGHILSNYIPIIVELAYQNTSLRIQSQDEQDD
jgi:hypothetical protein